MKKSYEAFEAQEIKNVTLPISFPQTYRYCVTVTAYSSAFTSAVFALNWQTKTNNSFEVKNTGNATMKADIIVIGFI